MKHLKLKSKKIGRKFNKIGKGAVKRLDSVGKFSAGVVKQQSDTVAGAVKGLTNPGVLIIGGVIAIFVFINYA